MNGSRVRSLRSARRQDPPIARAFDPRLIDFLPAPAYVCGAPSGLILRFNSYAAALWGREPERGDTDARFCASFKLYQGDGAPMPHSKSPMAEVLRDGRPTHDRESVFERPDGSWFAVSMSVNPIRDDAGAMIGALGIFHDITERKRRDEALSSATQMLRTVTARLAGGRPAGVQAQTGG